MCAGGSVGCEIDWCWMVSHVHVHCALCIVHVHRAHVNRSIAMVVMCCCDLVVASMHTCMSYAFARGGCVVALVREEEVHKFIAEIKKNYYHG